MPPTLDDNQMTAINAYLDGLMSEAEVQAFEVQLAEDETLRQHVEWQRSIQQRLKVGLNLDQLRANIEQKIERPAPVLRLRTFALVGLAAAAAIALSFVFSEINDRWTGFGSNGGGYNIPDLPPAEIYNKMVAAGFQPYEVCTAEQVPGWTEKKLGVRLALTEIPDDVKLIGWSYGYYMPGKLLGDHAGVFLTRVTGKEVLVVMDKLEFDRDLTETGGEDLHVYRRELGGLVFYEFSPLSEAHINPLFTLDDVAPETDQ